MKNTMDVGGPKMEPKKPSDDVADFEDSFGPNRSTVNDVDLFVFSISYQIFNLLAVVNIS